MIRNTIAGFYSRLGNALKITFENVLSNSKFFFPFLISQIHVIAKIQNFQSGSAGTDMKAILPNV